MIETETQIGKERMMKPAQCPHCRSTEITEPFESDGTWWECAECETRLYANGQHSTLRERAPLERYSELLKDVFDG